MTNTAASPVVHPRDLVDGKYVNRSFSDPEFGFAARPITVHGRAYTVDEAIERQTELAELNEVNDDSDGRVTEGNALAEAIAAASPKPVVDAATAAARWEAEKTAEARAWSSQQVRKAQSELANLKAWDRRNVPADHRIEYEDGAHRRVAYYTTEDGFLKALIRLHSAPTRYSVIHVD
jgi:hypothetical protein